MEVSINSTFFLFIISILNWDHVEQKDSLTFVDTIYIIALTLPRERETLCCSIKPFLSTWALVGVNEGSFSSV